MFIAIASQFGRFCHPCSISSRPCVLRVGTREKILIFNHGMSFIFRGKIPVQCKMKQNQANRNVYKMFKSTMLIIFNFKLFVSEKHFVTTVAENILLLIFVSRAQRKGYVALCQEKPDAPKQPEHFDYIQNTVYVWSVRNKKNIILINYVEVITIQKLFVMVIAVTLQAQVWLPYLSEFRQCSPFFIPNGKLISSSKLSTI